jgi:hypothetical protein
MYRPERILQLLRQRYVAWLPWIRQATKAQVEVLPLGHGNAFKVTATWRDGSHEKIYDAATALSQGRVRCARDFARTFVHEVLSKRGVV